MVWNKINLFPIIYEFWYVHYAIDRPINGSDFVLNLIEI